MIVTQKTNNRHVQFEESSHLLVTLFRLWDFKKTIVFRSSPPFSHLYTPMSYIIQ